MIKINREKLAWAAGFFDGEGHVKATEARRRISSKPTVRLQLAVAQVDKEVLDKFKDAVGGLGHIYGPYGPYKTNHQPYYLYCTTNFEEAQAVISMLWPWLGTKKRNQAKLAKDKASEQPPVVADRDKKTGRFVSVRR